MTRELHEWLVVASSVLKRGLARKMSLLYSVVFHMVWKKKVRISDLSGCTYISVCWGEKETRKEINKSDGSDAHSQLISFKVKHSYTNTLLALLPLSELAERFPGQDGEGKKQQKSSVVTVIMKNRYQKKNVA